MLESEHVTRQLDSQDREGGVKGAAANTLWPYLSHHKTEDRKQSLRKRSSSVSARDVLGGAPEPQALTGNVALGEQDHCVQSPVVGPACLRCGERTTSTS